MEALAQRFIEERARRGAHGRGRRVPHDLRRLAVRFATRWIAEGGSTSAASRRLGVQAMTLERWIDESNEERDVGDAGFCEVVVRNAPSLPPSIAGLSLVTPAGFRIDGLTFAEVSTLLSQLG